MLGRERDADDQKRRRASMQRCAAKRALLQGVAAEHAAGFGENMPLRVTIDSTSSRRRCLLRLASHMDVSRDQEVHVRTVWGEGPSFHLQKVIRNAAVSAVYLQTHTRPSAAMRRVRIDTSNGSVTGRDGFIQYRYV